MGQSQKKKIYGSGDVYMHNCRQKTYIYFHCCTLILSSCPYVLQSMLGFLYGQLKLMPIFILPTYTFLSCPFWVQRVMYMEAVTICSHRCLLDQQRARIFILFLLNYSSKCSKQKRDQQIVRWLLKTLQLRILCTKPTIHLTYTMYPRGKTGIKLPKF